MQHLDMPRERAASSADRAGSPELATVLEALIRTCKDGEAGFMRASQDINRGEYKNLFGHYASQRREYANELSSLVRALGENPPDRGTVLGALHRGWIDAKAAAVVREEHAILAECERGEDAAKRSYESALKKGLPEEVRRIVQRQYGGVVEAHDRIRLLRGPI